MPTQSLSTRIAASTLHVNAFRIQRWMTTTTVPLAQQVEKHDTQTTHTIPTDRLMLDRTLLRDQTALVLWPSLHPAWAHTPDQGITTHADHTGEALMDTETTCLIHAICILTLACLDLSDIWDARSWSPLPTYLLDPPPASPLPHVVEASCPNPSLTSSNHGFSNTQATLTQPRMKNVRCAA